MTALALAIAAYQSAVDATGRAESVHDICSMDTLAYQEGVTGRAMLAALSGVPEQLARQEHRIRALEKVAMASRILLAHDEAHERRIEEWREGVRTLAAALLLYVDRHDGSSNAD